MPKAISDLPLLEPAALITAWVLLALGLVFFLLPFARRRSGAEFVTVPWLGWLIYALLMALISAFSVLLVQWVLVYLIGSLSQNLPLPIVLLAIVMVAVILLAVTMSFLGSWRRRLLACAATLASIIAVSMLANAYFGYYQRLGDLLSNTAEVKEFSLNPQESASPEPLRSASGPGSVSKIIIPGKKSGFQGRESFIWTPPTVEKNPSARFPVLLILPADPGSPEDYLSAAKVPEAMDAYAQKNDGFAPIVVIADSKGSYTNNTVCADTPAGKAGSYLSQDVPEWIKKNLPVRSDAGSWTVAGFSFGGTCAMQMVTGYPKLYGNALVFAGEYEPLAANTKQETIDKLFAGDSKKYDQINPVALMKKQHYPNTQVTFLYGDADTIFGPGMQKLSEEAAAAGMKVRTTIFPETGHVWPMVSDGLGPSLQQLNLKVQPAQSGSSELQNTKDDGG